MGLLDNLGYYLDPDTYGGGNNSGLLARLANYMAQPQGGGYVDDFSSRFGATPISQIPVPRDRPASAPQSPQDTFDFRFAALPQPSIPLPQARPSDAPQIGQPDTLDSRFSALPQGTTTTLSAMRRGPSIDELIYGSMSPAGMTTANASLPNGAPGANSAPTANVPQVSAPPQMQPQMQMQAPVAGIGDRLTAGLMGFTQSGGPLSAIGNLIQGLATGQRTDPQGMMQQQMAATYHAMRQAGIPDGMAQAAALNPEVFKTVASEYFGGPKVVQLSEGPLGKQFGIQQGGNIYDTDGRLVFGNPRGGQGAPVAQAPTGASSGSLSGNSLSSYLAPGVKGINSNLVGQDYLNQFSPETQAAIKTWMESGTQPVGNPRAQGMAALIRTIGPKVAQDMGVPMADLEARWAARHKMQSDLGSSSNSSMGGILSNGKSAFDHLATLSDRFVDLGSSSGPNMPGGALVGRAGNFLQNEYAAKPDQAGRMAGVRDAAQKYGAESTKFYAGTGGGEGERLMALHEQASSGTLASEQAAFLETERDLMQGRLQEKENQIRDIMGQDYLDKHPVMTPQLQKQIDRINGNITKLRGGSDQPQGQGTPQIQEGATATNPQTGQRIIFKGGKWMQQ